MPNIIFLVFFSLFIASCGGGLSPEDQGPAGPEGFSGTIKFIGSWPAGVMRTHLVAFKEPLKSAADFNVTNLKYISLEIPGGVSSYDFNSLDGGYLPANGTLGAGTYKYVAVVQSKTLLLSLNRSDWTVAGVYYADGNTSQPGILIIPEGTVVEDINISCDFGNPPPQPPKTTEGAEE